VDQRLRDAVLAERVGGVKPVHASSRRDHEARRADRAVAILQLGQRVSDRVRRGDVVARRRGAPVD